ncbi:kallikrein-15-like [Carettochelys insculpta]|uniref:kallikrein-15-like n=1 Tax=Carettochelys insculpta TaxID=44489 RepID=UPI003EBB0CCF
MASRASSPRLRPAPSSSSMKVLNIVLLLGAAVAPQASMQLRGQPCQPHSQPWQAAIFDRSRYNCGATLISNTWVLTAAHCHTGAIHVRLGKHSLYTHESTEQYKAVSKIITHPGYNYTNHSNDIMLLKLQTPAQLNAYVQPLGLASHCVAPGKQCSVSGWGNTINAPENVSIILYCTKVLTISEEECAATFPGHVNGNMLCAGLEGGGTDSCEGDSGGPLVCDGKLQGVVSWGDVPCISTLKPSVYMNVCKYYNWLTATMWEN